MNSTSRFWRWAHGALLGAVLSVGATGPSFGQVSVNVGTLQPGQTVTITYEVAIDAALPSSVTHLSSQGAVSGTGFSLNTDDPETTAANDPTLTLIGNHSPVPGLDTVQRGASEDVKVQVAALLGNDTDAENDSLSVTGVGSLSIGGAAVTMNGGWIYYAHIGASADSFTYTVSDGRGGTAQGTVLVQIKDADGQARSILAIAVDGSGAHLRADGIPGRTYTIQYKDDVNDPWQTLGTATADPDGIYSKTDGAGTLLRIYRSVLF